MARARTGSVETFTAADGSNYYKARIRLADGSRVRVDIPAKHAGDQESRERYALARQQLEDEKGVELKKRRKAAEALKPAPRGGLTFDEYREKIAEARASEGKSGVTREQRRWRTRVSPTLGKRPIAAITRTEVEDFRDALDAEVRKRIKLGKPHGLAGKSAMNVWSLVRGAFDEAVNSRDRLMRVRADDPSAGVKPPLPSPERKKTYVTPAEFSHLIACELVPRVWREIYAIGAYLYLRPGELRALTFGDLDLDAGICHVTKAYDEEARTTKTPKTAAGMRDVPIPPTLLPLLRSLYQGAQENDAAPVAAALATVNEHERARQFVAHLKLAGCKRARLYENGATTMPVNFRSLRDSGITWAALAGVPLAALQRRAGHESVTTTLGYMKIAEDLTGNAGVPFPPLPFAPPTGGGSSGGLIGPATGQVAAIVNETAENPYQDERPRRESNPR